MRLMRRKSEEGEKVKSGDKMCLFAYNVSSTSPSGRFWIVGDHPGDGGWPHMAVVNLS